MVVMSEYGCEAILRLGRPSSITQPLEGYSVAWVKDPVITRVCVGVGVGIEAARGSERVL